MVAGRAAQPGSSFGGFMHRTRAVISIVAVLGLTRVLVAQAPALNLKPGLWENTITTSIGGMPPVDTSKMPPEQAARIAEAMKAMSGDKATTTKDCVKKADLEKEG